LINYKYIILDFEEYISFTTVIPIVITTRAAFKGGRTMATTASGVNFLGVPKYCCQKFAHLWIIELLKLFWNYYFFFLFLITVSGEQKIFDKGVENIYFEVPTYPHQ
jgi:hypothetical protein